MARQNKSHASDSPTGGKNAPAPAKSIPGDFSCGILLFNDQKKITAYNSEAARLIGWTNKNAPPTFEDLPATLQTLVQNGLKKSGAFQDEQVVISAADKTGNSLRAQTIPAHSSKGEISSIIVLLHDVTALDENMRRFERLATLGTLSASMAHEIKNALVPIKTFTDLLVEKNQDAELGEIVRREMNRIDSIVSQMLRFGVRVKSAFSPTSVHEILDHGLRLIQHELDRKQIQLHRAFTAPTDLVRGDAHQLEQAFINLLFNALEAMRSQGKLSVATEIVTEDLEKQLRIQIRDTGVGIAAENIPQLFEPFFTTKKDGTGLGLPITRRIIQEHRGSISVESELGKGTTFSVQFPLHQRSD